MQSEVGLDNNQANYVELCYIYQWFLQTPTHQSFEKSDVSSPPTPRKIKILFLAILP